MTLEDFKVCYGIEGKVDVIGKDREGQPKLDKEGLNKKPRMITQKLFKQVIEMSSYNI